MKVNDVLFIVASNFIPVVGIFFFGWKLSAVLVFYIFDLFFYSLFIGAKCRRIEKEKGADVDKKNNLEQLFFFPIVLFGFFVIVVALFEDLTGADLRNILLVSLLTVPYYIYDYKRNFIEKREWEQSHEKSLLKSVFIHLTLIGIIIVIFILSMVYYAFVSFGPEPFKAMALIIASVKSFVDAYAFTFEKSTV